MRRHKKDFNQFLLAYFLAILTFAIIYTCISNQFYYNLSNYEKLFSKEVNYINEGIENSIKNNFIDYYGKDSILLGSRSNGRQAEFLFNINDLKVDDLHIEDSLFTVNVTVSIKNISEKDITYKTAIQVTLSRDDEMLYNNFVYRICDVSIRNSGKYATYLKDINIEPIFYINSNSINRVTGVTFSNDFDRKLETYIRMNDGIPSPNSGKQNLIYYFKWNFSRMLYLSMVTITTLGYGDIVPLTNIARILIGFEATLGIIILGWFCNKLIKKT